MKKKPTKLKTWQEVYFYKKHKRQEWWKNNWHNFFLYPVMGVAVAIVLSMIVFILSCLFYSIGKANDVNFPKPCEHKCEPCKYMPCNCRITGHSKPFIIQSWQSSDGSDIIITNSGSYIQY